MGHWVCFWVRDQEWSGRLGVLFDVGIINLALQKRSSEQDFFLHKLFVKGRRVLLFSFGETQTAHPTWFPTGKNACFDR